MKQTMRVPILLVCSAMMLNCAHAEVLSSADREALLDSLAKLREAAEGKVDAKFRVALAAYRAASASDDAAIELYLNCVERVNFDEKQKKSSDFRDWKRKEADKLADPGMRAALRIQLRWLILTLQSVPEKADRIKLAADAQQVLDQFFSAPEKFKDQLDLLGQPVLTTVFASAYEINRIKVHDWPLAPTQLDAVYNQIIMPPLRTPSRLAELHSAWVKRIQQESVRAEYWNNNRGNGKKIGFAGAENSPAYTKFLEETRPSLQWDMELDLFRAGDESGAATRMLAHLEKNITHPSAQGWSDQLGNLLKPASPPQPPTASTATGNPAP